MSFDHLGLSEEVLAAIADRGYTEPTPIQTQAIPSVLMGRDILGIAQTGTGKTAGFTLPMIDILAQGRSRARMPRSLILEPTRELAAQVAESFEIYGKNNKLTMALLIGGVSFSDQEKKLDRGVDVLIATPGRLLDHFGRGKLMLTGIEILVVDEADRMLDMGFIPDVEKICSLITRKHQSLFFSATMPPPVKKLTDQFLTDPKMIEVARPASVVETVKQNLVLTSSREKRDVLRKILRQDGVKNAIVFCNRKRDVKEIFTTLKHGSFNVGQLHGDLDQSERMRTLAAFKDGAIQILVASDVAARGLDIPNVSHIVNYDVPFHAEDYVHRIGRTGRAGREGHAFTIACSSDSKYINAIENLIKTKIPLNALDGSAAKQSAAAPSEDDKPEKSQRRRKPSGDRQRPENEKKAASEHAQRPEQEKPASSARSRKPNRENEARKDTKPAPKKRASEDMSAATPKGWGGHMPAFMTRTPDSEN